VTYLATDNVQWHTLLRPRSTVARHSYIIGDSAS